MLIASLSQFKAPIYSTSIDGASVLSSTITSSTEVQPLFTFVIVNVYVPGAATSGFTISEPDKICPSNVVHSNKIFAP